MARIDSFLAQLVAYEADALLVESGDNLYLAKGDQRLPLMQVRAGAIVNAHVIALLGEIAPAAVRAQLERAQLGGDGAPGASEPIAWDYQWGTLFFHVEVVLFAGLLHARVRDATLHAPAGTSATAKASATSTPANVLDDSVDERQGIELYLRAALERGGSDLHLTAGRVAMVRVDGDMTPLFGAASGALDPYGLQKMIEQMVPDRAKVDLEATHDVDFSFDLAPQCHAPGARVRCNVFKDSTGVGGVFRCFPLQPPSALDIGLPDNVVEMCARRHGLIIVAGAAGSGKSTTIAGMVDWINENRADHVVTIEDPVEIMHAPKRCLVNQRQVGEHTGSFARALRAAQREDPDVIVVGEVRDLETLTMVLELAETHLVIVAMRSTSAAAALERIIDRFSAEAQRAARNLLAECLVGVVAQTLCKRAGGGRVAAFDVLVPNAITAAQLRDGNTRELPRTLDDQLRRLVARGAIHENEALARALDKHDFLARPRAVA